MKYDINTKEDIINLVDTFYSRIQENSAIGPIFTQIMQVNWDHHLPKMYDFWESILFGKATYKGNPMLTHIEINKHVALKNEEFEVWKALFFDTVDDLFEGENATLIKQKAQSIADLMHFKINSPKSNKKII